MNRSDRVIKYKIFNGTYSDRYAGYLTPAEVLRCIVLGFKLNPAWKLSDIEDRKNKGISNPAWVYFYPNKEIKKFMQ